MPPGSGLAALTFVVFSYGLDLSLPTGTLAEQYLLPAEEDERALQQAESASRQASSTGRHSANA